MKILTICNLFPPNVIGGAEILTKNLVDALRKDHEVFVLTSSCQVSFPSHVISELQRWDPDNPPSCLERLRVRRRNHSITRKILIDYNPDIVLVSDLRGLSYSPIHVAQRSKPTVTFLHDGYSFAEARPLSGRSTLRQYLACVAIFGFRLRLHHVLANSKATLLHQPPFITVERSTVVHVGIPQPISFYGTHRHAEHESKQILYIGRIVPEKGIHMLIVAMRRIYWNIEFENVHLVIAGFATNQTYLKRLKELVRQYHLGDIVSFKETVTESEKYKHFYEADVFVFPSLWEEGLGQTYLEAMSCGLPCVCTSGGRGKRSLN